VVVAAVLVVAVLVARGNGLLRKSLES